MSAGNWRDKWRGKKIVPPEPKPMTAKNVHDLTIEQVRRWAGKALDHYLYLDAQSKNMKLEEQHIFILFLKKYHTPHLPGLP